MSEVIDTNGYIIEPWDHLAMTQSPDGSVHDQYVPPELEALARQVMTRYEMSVSEMTLITAKPDKGGAIWRIMTDQGPRSIKVLHREPNRSLFSIAAQDYLVKQGARVPSLIETRSGEQYVNAGGKSWIVTEWIEPLEPVSKVDIAGVQELCRGLGEFHRLSRGYEPPFGAIKASRLYRWSKHYEKIMAKLQWFEDIAETYAEYPASNRLLSMLPQVKAEAQDYYMMFRDSAYERMIAKGEPYWGLAHQDYGWSNGQMGPGGIWIIDLDGVAYDLPIRDLRKLITSTMVDNGGWDLEWIRSMIAAYSEGNPIDREIFELLWIDMAFPNEFYKHVKEVVYEPELFIPTELEPILQVMQNVEMNKWDVLNELRKDMELYPSGDYPSVEEAPPLMMPITLPQAAAWSELASLPVDEVPLSQPAEPEPVMLQEAVHEAPLTIPMPAPPLVAAEAALPLRSVRSRRPRRAGRKRISSTGRRGTMAASRSRRTAARTGTSSRRRTGSNTRTKRTAGASSQSGARSQARSRMRASGGRRQRRHSTARRQPRAKRHRQGVLRVPVRRRRSEMVRRTTSVSSLRRQMERPRRLRVRRAASISA
ncbi:hypothetical protein PRECH8_04370 [Insulibacter thermoxylanivorax]|uniref:Spore coat protein, CotS family n=1 Tax=Insulibacter thermoxylanivorax TaxID=2749268 RepID=A0A916QER3_9BACL|nr:CotS family spore coat protein [Insulibacter thermoxylanivorax]GFR37141.1 hypothetical protein PRECH8_04370 [Insulibacter thermoxylanivorax]